MVMPIDPPFLLESVSGEVFAAVTVPAWLACAALWRRAEVLRDRQDAQEAADKKILVDLVKEVVAVLKEHTDALKGEVRAS